MNPKFSQNDLGWRSYGELRDPKLRILPAFDMDLDVPARYLHMKIKK